MQCWPPLRGADPAAKPCMPRRDQDQHAIGSQQDGMAVARAGRHSMPDDLPARAAYRVAVLDAGYFEKFSSDLRQPTPLRSRLGKTVEVNDSIERNVDVNYSVERLEVVTEPRP